MHEVVLVIHLILAVAIIALVLIQRSSGGGLGIGGGSGGLGDFATARGAANALTKATTLCAFAFFATSLSLAYMGKGTSQAGLLSAYKAEAPATPATDGDKAAAPAMPAAPADTITEPAKAGKDSAPKTPEPPVSTE
jgi:preprotein translocase subunit SecG